jgi:hypothetical protein
MYKGIFLSFKVDNDSQLNWSNTAKRVEKDGQSKFQLSNHSEQQKQKQKGMPQLDQVVYKALPVTMHYICGPRKMT